MTDGSDNKAPQNNTVPKNIKYLIVGCGGVGYNILKEINDTTDRILVIDKDSKRVEDLRSQNYNALLGDISDTDILSNIPKSTGIVFISISNSEVITLSVQKLKELLPDAYIIVKTDNISFVDSLVENGADVVLYPQQVVAKSAITHMNNLLLSTNAKKLMSILSGWSGKLGIITHKNPDPDAISSAMALQLIAKIASNGQLEADIFYEGNIGHQENRAFVNTLNIDIKRLTKTALKTYDYIAMVDCVGPGLNNAVPADTPINIIIDHHNSDGFIRVKAPDFIDSRPTIGSTASILTQYIQDLHITIDKKLATALLYGIRSDTHNFKTNVSSVDLNNIFYLLPLIDNSLLESISAPSMSQETLDIIGKSILNRDVQTGGYLFSNIGYVMNRDSIPIAADMLLELEGINTVIVYGITDTFIEISARNKDVRLNIGDILKEVASNIEGASAGGHTTMGGLSIPLNVFKLVPNKETLLNLVIQPIISDLMKLFGITEVKKDEN